jgi:hypothetical protein
MKNRNKRVDFWNKKKLSFFVFIVFVVAIVKRERDSNDLFFNHGKRKKECSKMKWKTKWWFHLAIYDYKIYLKELIVSN